MAAAVLGGVKDIYIRPGSKVLYLGASTGITVSYISDIIGSEGVVYAVEISKRVGINLVHMAKKRTNVIPIIHDARKPVEYRYLVGMVDMVFVDIARPDQAKITAENCKYFLKNGGHFMISIKAKCIDCTRHPNIAFANEVIIEGNLGQYSETIRIDT